MNSPKKIVVLVGSLRKDSLSAALAKTLARIAPAGSILEVVPIGGMPFYNPDLEQDRVESWEHFREHVRGADAILFITPEYNRSIPAVLKNAIDVGSRPYGKGALNGKPAAVISLSQGLMGGFGAAHHLRQSLVCLNVPVMPAPEVYLSYANKLLDDKGDFIVPGTGVFLANVLTAFSSWIARNTGPGNAEGQHAG
ncbi:MAG: NAD(P)H-dependent oxidoreductase [Pseudomonadota bacterium]